MARSPDKSRGRKSTSRMRAVLRNQGNEWPGISRGGETLTKRQVEIARLVAQGLPNKTIAGRLGVEVGTVKIHLHNIYQKLRFAQHRALGRKVSDEFTVPLCRGHHRELHRCGDEAAWWSKAGIDPLGAARTLWTQTHPLRSVAEAPNPDQSAASGVVTSDLARRTSRAIHRNRKSKHPAAAVGSGADFPF